MNSRPLKPLQKIDNQYIECTFADTYEKIAVQMEATSPESTLAYHRSFAAFKGSITRGSRV